MIIEVHYKELDLHFMDMLCTLAIMERDYADETDGVKAMTSLLDYLRLKQLECYDILDKAAITVHKNSAKAEIVSEHASNV